jgi:hypothetical protein
MALEGYLCRTSTRPSALLRANHGLILSGSGNAAEVEALKGRLFSGFDEICGFENRILSFEHAQNMIR